MGKYSEACGITLLCDKNHNKLAEPQWFPSHKKAKEWLGRSYAFVYHMVRNGEAVEDVHSEQHISAKAQSAGRQSDAIKVSLRESLMDIARGVKVTDPLGNVEYYESVMRVTDSIGAPFSTVYHCCEGMYNSHTVRGNGSVWIGWTFEYVN